MHVDDSGWTVPNNGPQDMQCLGVSFWRVLFNSACFLVCPMLHMYVGLKNGETHSDVCVGFGCVRCCRNIELNTWLVVARLGVGIWVLQDCPDVSLVLVVVLEVVLDDAFVGSSR